MLVAPLTCWILHREATLEASPTWARRRHVEPLKPLSLPCPLRAIEPQLTILPTHESPLDSRCVGGVGSPEWRAKTGVERGKLLRRWFDLIIANREDLAAIMTAECGKPMAESLGEISYAASFVEWFAEEAKRVYGDVIPATTPGKRLLVIKQPIGVVGAITCVAGFQSLSLLAATSLPCPVDSADPQEIETLRCRPWNFPSAMM